MRELRRRVSRGRFEVVSLWWRSLPRWVFLVRMHCLRRSEEVMSLLLWVDSVSVRFKVVMALWSCCGLLKWLKFCCCFCLCELRLMLGEGRGRDRLRLGIFQFLHSFCFLVLMGCEV